MQRRLRGRFRGPYRQPAAGSGWAERAAAQPGPAAGTGRPNSEGVQEFSRTFRWSAGAGLVIPTVFGRFEANYVVVLSNQENDRLRRGIQLGFVASSLM